MAVQGEMNPKDRIKEERTLHAREFFKNVLMPIVQGGQRLTEELVTKSLSGYRNVHKGTEGEKLALGWVEGKGLFLEAHGQVLQERGWYVENQALVQKTLENLFELDILAIDWRFEFGTEPPKVE